MSILKPYAVVVMGFVSLALLTGCSRSLDQKVADAKANVIAAEQNVRDAAADAQVAARAEWLDSRAKWKPESRQTIKLLPDNKRR